MIPICRTFRFVASSVAISAEALCQEPGGNFSAPTTRRSNCDCLRTSHTIRRSSAHSRRVAIFTGKRRLSFSASRWRRLPRRCGPGQRRSTSPRSMGREHTHSRGNSRSPTPKRRSLSPRISSDFAACASTSIPWSRWRKCADTWRPSFTVAATSRSSRSGTSTFARLGSGWRQTRPFRDQQLT